MPRFSYISHLQCPKCKKIYAHTEKQHLCSCGAPLLVDYDIDSLRAQWHPEDLQIRGTSLWRYHELLPVQSAHHVVSLSEGMTPLNSMPKMAESMGIKHLLMKDEGSIPTGTFKARGAAVGISKALELGVKSIIMPTNGNAGAAWSLYASRAGIQATIVMPVEAPEITRKECTIAGANLYLVDGLISDAGKMVAAELKEAPDLYDASTLKEPYRIEGKKTMGLEILEQLDWQVPDVILYPCGGGVGLIGIYKALRELQRLGWIGDRLPRLVAVQAEGCAPIVKAWEEGRAESEFWPHSKTVAFGINVPKALGDFLILEALKATEGYAIAIDDETVLQEQQRVARLEGAFICPEGAATFAAARQLRDKGWIKAEETVVTLNTGNGLKYPNTVQSDAPLLKPGTKLNDNRHKTK
ncbi:threonine synthase [Pullulanibacillus camelliae]|uniref:Threonine synthase n=1 Tax=Pullulanibacillus camelliae TaxID=1707096 RepID=A0A8J2VLK4_9BACL|nr:threonine synthase [Pullulanibacillus camelliae]GGE36689.1 threonine synthase [Pullulanibacillus camelliae]